MPISKHLTVSLLAILLITLLIIWSPWIQFATSNRQADATILESASLIRSDTGRVHTITYQFAPANGEAITVTEQLYPTRYEAVLTGKTVTVRYSASNPEFAMIEGNGLKVLNDGFMQLIVTLGVLALILAVPTYLRATAHPTT